MRLIYKEGGRTHDYYLRDGYNVVGRSPKCDLVLFDTSVSKQHIKLKYNKRRSEVIIKDLGSANGSQINGQRIREVVLSDGDVISIGQTKLMFTTAEDDLSETDVERVFGADMDELEASALRPFLFIEDDDGERNFPLGYENVTIGHKAGNDIVVVGNGVSRFHSEIYFDENSWWVKDLKSRNGTFVNGGKIGEDTELEEDDYIQVGTVSLTFQFPREETVVDRFKALDPKIKFPIIMGVALFLCIVIYAFTPKEKSSGPVKKNVAKVIKKIIADGITLIQQDKLDKAVDFLEDQHKDHPSSNQIPLLKDIAKQLQNQSTFDFKDWDALKGKLNQLKAMLDEDSDDLKFIKDKIKLIEREKINSDRLKKAEGKLKLRYPQAGDLLTAYETLNRIDTTSIFATQKEKYLIDLRERLSKLLAKEGDNLSNPVRPQWSKAVQKYREAKKYSQRDTTFATEIEARIQKCLKERKALNNLRQGKRYYEDGDFDKALQYLSQIPDDSQYYREAAETLKALQKHGAMAKARVAFEQGDGERALRHLRGVGSHPRVKRLYNKILKTVDHMSKAQREQRLNNRVKAIYHAKKVLRYVPNNQNYYHVGAKKVIDDCTRTAKYMADQKYKEGRRALERESFNDARDQWKRALENDIDGTYRKKILSTIKYRANEIYSGAEYLKNSNEPSKRTKAKSIYLFLKAFLPRQHKLRPKIDESMKELYKY